MATLWTACLLAGLAVLTAVLMSLAAVIVARHRAEAAADLSALAAAAYGPWGEEYACAQARWVTEKMEVSLVGCSMGGWDVDVQVAASVAGLGSVTGRARAGPAGP
jgi:secretion/DNA translocation related TadE-like protein